MSKVTTIARDLAELSELIDSIGKTLDRRRRRPPQKRLREKFWGNVQSAYATSLVRRERLSAELARLLTEESDRLMRPRPGHPVPDALVPWMS